MKRLVALYLSLLALGIGGGEAACAQSAPNFVNVITSSACITDDAGNPLAQGGLSVQAVNGSKQAINFSIPGTMVSLNGPVNALLQDGELVGTLRLPNPAVTSPQGIGYTFIFTNGGTSTAYQAVAVSPDVNGNYDLCNLAVGQYYPAMPVSFPGGFWSGSTYYPSGSVVLSNGLAYLAVAPSQGTLPGYNPLIWASLGSSSGSSSGPGTTGATGATGPAGTITIATTANGAAGTNASVTNSGSSTAAVLHFTIPQGATGATGATGPQGPAGPGTGGGTAATVTAGTATSLPAGSTPTVTNAGTSSAAILNFGIPGGATGATGLQGATGATGPVGPQGPSGSAGNSTAFTTYLADVPTTTTGVAGSAGATVGTAAGAVDTQSSGGISLALAAPLPAGPLTSISLNFGSAPGGATVTIYILNVTGSTFAVADTFTLTPANTAGVQTFVAGTDFAARNVSAGQLIAYTGPVSYSQASNIPFYYISGTPTTTPVAWSLEAGSGTLRISATVGSTANTSVTSYANTVPFGASGAYHSIGLVPDPGANSGATRVLREDGNWAAPAVAESAPFLVSAGRTVLKAETFTAGLPSGWVTVGGGSWTAGSGGGLVSPSATTGYGVYAYAPDYFAIERRTIRVRFTLLAAGTIVGIGSFSDNGEPTLASNLLFDANANQLVVQNYGNPTSSSPGNVSTVALGFTPVVGTMYQVTIDINRRQFTMSVFDPSSGIEASISSGNNVTATGYYQGDGAAAGLFLDHLRFSAVAGQFEVNNYQVLADAKNPKVLFMGDSITQGYELPLVNRWSQIAAQQVGNAVISGRSGSYSSSALARCQAELPTLLPEYLVLMIGTNDALGGSVSSFETNYAAIITLAASLNVRLVAVLLPPENEGSGTAANVAAINAWLLSQSGIYGYIHFNLALSSGHDGVTWNSALMQSGAPQHPNAAGGVAMAAWIQGEAPYLFDSAALQNQQTVNGLQFVGADGFLYQLTVAAGGTVTVARVN